MFKLSATSVDRRRPLLALAATSAPVTTMADAGADAIDSSPKERDLTIAELAAAEFEPWEGDPTKSSVTPAYSLWRDELPKLRMAEAVMFKSKRELIGIAAAMPDELLISWVDDLAAVETLLLCMADLACAARARMMVAVAAHTEGEALG